jgi:3-mercaptopyruvate sulfurtransferase SseA
MLRLLVAALFIAGCQVTPTKTSESQQRGFQTLVEKSSQPVVLDESMVILDARPSFDYGLNRVQGSLHFTWENLAEDAATGEILRDTRQAGLRLALLGITPATPVVVVGNGGGGDGGEGRLAWTLLYLGVRDVQVARFDVFRKDWTQATTAPAKNVPAWIPERREDLVVSPEEFDRLARDARGRMENRVWIIDVRSEREYFRQLPATKAVPDIGAMHIPWTDFYNDKGRPNSALRKKLTGLGIQPSDRVILLSERGVRSAAAAYALLALGYTRVQNFIKR